MFSLWSLSVWAKSLSWLTVSIIVELFSCRNPRISESAWLSVPRVLSRWRELSASTCDTDATFPANCTICSLLADSALTSTCRFLTVPKMSLRESPSRPATCESSLQRVVERFALAVERVRGLVDRRAQRPLHRSRRRAQLDGQLGQRLLDLVPFHRDRGAGQVDASAVGQRRPAGVCRGELNEPRRHQVRRDDDGLGVLRNLHVLGHRHGDLDVGRPRLDRVDRTDRDPQDADLVAGIEADGGREVADDRSVIALRTNSTYTPATSTATSAMTVA